MTETVGTAATGGAADGSVNGSGGGLRVRRVYTTEGVHPYDEVTWEHRDVVMTNWRDGSVNFEQRGVEFPEFWSVNAVNIVTSKYFRGAVGTPQREHSLKQLIDRVVKTYVGAGEKHGYFATPEDTEIFEHELTWMLMHQVFSFNSPVWFNVGTSSPQQVSACLSYDTLVSTPAGLIPIGRLVEDDAVGTKVYDAHGVTRILATKANGVKDVYRLHAKAGYTLDVTADHLVWKATGDGTGQFVEAGTLRPGDQLEWHRRESYGEGEFTFNDMWEAALAGWLQADGSVACYDGRLRIEAITVTDAELDWVRGTIDQVFPGAYWSETKVPTQSTELDCRRTKLYGKQLRPFVEKWDLLRRGVDMEVPPALFTAPLPVVTAYLQSLFQAEGYVSARERSTLVGLDMVGEKHVRGVQSLLMRYGIFSRVRFKRDVRDNRLGCWSLGIQNAGDRLTFATEIGFIDPVKAAKLESSFDKPGRATRPTKRLEIDRIESLGAMDVYDIQTESGEFLAGNLRVHNCFILAVDDTMDSILNWYKEEGLIFKGGSGAGLNLSRIRSSKELLSSGGTASGPVSFMRGADASAGTIKSGGATRRAAKMVVLDVDHPDVEEFIETKAREENKIRALRDAGFDMDLGGTDITSVQYQNANNSVRVSDEFMHAVESSGEFGLRSRTTGEAIETVDAKKLFRKLATAAWECADPGIQYDDTINAWHTCPESGRITASNPCSEYMHLDNSSCNLASLNLMKFLREDGTFDAETFAKAVEIVITAMDISITFADFPTDPIGETTRKFRQLGIGYANLGALLMATGHAYDSDGGRALSASITSLMTGTAYRRSAELAAVVGPYEGYKRNADAHQKVMRRHAAANDLIRTYHSNDATVQQLATREWQAGLEIGARKGWRNAQASVLAPTGTIGLMMDCDTTGIEPDLALVKFKKLVGGGSMQIVNQTVPRALTSLGYQDEQVEAIVEYVAEHGHVIDAPGLRREHYDVFDCAMGERSIQPMGHVRMMAAVQPFLSGAISKTVNMPEAATVEEVEEIYFEGWKLGLKALAIYRDNCKVGQPLSAGKGGTKEAEPEKIVEYRPVRKRLPKKRPSQTVSFTVGGAEGYLHAGSYPDDGLGEIFVKLGKQGSTLAGVMDAFATSISVGLQYGIPLEFYVSKFQNLRFEPAGMTDDPDVRIATSLMDYLFRRLALDYLPYEKRAQLGIFTADERSAQVASDYGDFGGDSTDVDLEALSTSVDASSTARPAVESTVDAEPEVREAHSSTELLELQLGKAADAPLCMTCGTKMRPAGSCYVCEGCGSTSGCS
ncbi:ribonucleoside-diphosphate reductase class II [Herbihabitans rhizosphaerae]|uniref:Vitamin B12-dependent ribonucleotide reductase n=1 Tax=Herbihabitans rhizosphaerae TaxID=1872711 RepID=A0A4Q7KFX5_9PSEU|nr:vitamin B12-dependent ribonucleotide reductase [Herbihabitans rhizosphaerae]RZS30581.1 ribonucleoside-diphosphate reductase class II [Herbihabitans rhizosphaerae]